MSLITRLKPLFSSSRLFMPPDQLHTVSSEKKKNYPGPTKMGEPTGKDRNKGKGRGKGTNWKKVSKQYVKMGSGGTLDPLADGVLIVGVGSGTKDLPQFLHCTKTYRTTGLLGCETDSYDSEGAIARLAPWKHVTRELLEKHLQSFRGEIVQTPPIYSALKVDGKPLYEYARQGIPLPRPIEARKVTISRLELQAFTHSSSVVGESGHKFKFPSKILPENEVIERRKVLELVQEDPLSANVPELDDVNNDVGLTSDSKESHEVSEATNVAAGTIPPDDVPPIFELEMTVSSGTYVRSVVHDLGLAVGSAAHVVTLTRVQQGQFVLDDALQKDSTGQDVLSKKGVEETEAFLSRKPCVDWSILEKAVLKWENDQEMDVDEDGWAEWELEILNKWPIHSEESLHNNREVVVT
ncbi:pseudouridine synthase [Serendipita vermifera]|nr:pseudouridine synthase [Serendipita vermifera]